MIWILPCSAQLGENVSNYISHTKGDDPDESGEYLYQDNDDEYGVHVISIVDCSVML